MWAPHPPHFSTFSSFPDWLWPRCSLHIQLSVITLQKPLSWLSPTPLCHSVLHFPQCLQIPLGSWAGIAEFRPKMQLHMRKFTAWMDQGLPENPHSPPQNQVFLWTAAFSCRQKGHETIKHLNPSFHAQPPGFHSSVVKLFCIKRLNFWCWSFCFELQNLKNVISKLTCEHSVKAWMK